jgi:hypothetical chaperone protein
MSDDDCGLNDCGLFINERIARTEFEGYINGHVSRMKQCVDQLLSGAGLSPGDIDAVFLTGGSSFIPAIKKIFKETFPSKEIMPSGAFTSVSFGLGLDASTPF